MIRRKNPAWAAILSLFVFPGSGQIYNKEYAKGIFLAAASGILMVFSFKPMMEGYLNYLQTAVNVETMDLSKLSEQPIPKPNFLFTALMTFFWLYSSLDAYASAKKHNRSLPPLQP